MRFAARQRMSEKGIVVFGLYPNGEWERGWLGNSRTGGSTKS